MTGRQFFQVSLKVCGKIARTISKVDLKKNTYFGKDKLRTSSKPASNGTAMTSK